MRVGSISEHSFNRSDVAAEVDYITHDVID